MTIIAMFFLFNTSMIYYIGYIEWRSGQETKIILVSAQILNKISSAGYVFAHWLYTTQYIKTSLILPSLFRIALLLLKSKQANETEKRVKNATNFIQLEKDTDQILIMEKAHISKTKKNILIVDVFVSIALLILFFILEDVIR